MGSAEQRDEVLVGEVLGGRVEAFGTLVERYLPSVYGLVRARVGGTVEAEDVGQETFLNAYRALGSLREPAKFKAWLMGIARNTALKAAEKNQRAAAAQRALADTESAQEPQVVSNELKEMLWDQVQALEPNAREVLLLHYYSGNSTIEIAELLDISPEAVRKRLQRARAALGEKLLDALGEERPQGETAREKRERIMRAIAAAPIGVGVEAASAAAAAGAKTGTFAGIPLVWKAAASIAVLGAAAGVAFQLARDSNEEDRAVTNADVASASTPESSADAIAANDVAPDQEESEAPVEADWAYAFHEELPAGNGTIFGHVYDETGAPAVGATVVAFHFTMWDAPIAIDGIRRTRVSADGSFQLRRLPSDTRPHSEKYTVLAYSESGAATTTVWLSERGYWPRTARVRMGLKPKAEIRGQVVDENGVGVAGAQVIPSRPRPNATDYYPSEIEAAYVLTRADGSFELDALRGEAISLTVIANGFGSELREYIHSGEKPVVIDIGTGGVISGQLVRASDNEPLSGFDVEFFRNSSPDSVQRSTQLSDHSWSVTRDDGTFAIRGLDASRYLIITPRTRIRDNSHSGLVREFETITKPDDAKYVVLHAPDAGAIAGRVVAAATDFGVKLARVMVEGARGRVSGSFYTDGDGQFELPSLPADDYTLRVYDWFGTLDRYQSEPIPVSAGETVDIGDVGLEPIAEGFLRGQVVDENGHGIDDAVITVYGADMYSLTGHTDVGGSFTIRVSNRQSVHLRAQALGYAMDRVGPFVPDGEPAQLTMYREGIVRGRVVDVNRQPAVAVALRANLLTRNAVPSSYGIAWVLPESETVGDGSFEIWGMPPGTYQLALVQRPQDEGVPWQLAGNTKFDVEAGEVIEDLDLRLERWGSLSIAGRITNSSGQAVENARVRIGLSQYREDRQLRASTNSDAQGRYSFENLPDELLGVSVYHEDYATERDTEVEAGSSSVDFVLREKAEVSGRVLNASTRRPVTSFTINQGSIILPSSYARGFQNDEGEFTYQFDGADVNEFVVYTDGFEPAVVRPEHVRSVPPSKPLMIYLRPAAEVSGWVSDADGEPIAGAKVIAGHMPQNERTRSQIQGVMTDSDGAFTLTLPRSDAGRISAYKAGYSPGTTQVGGENHIVLRRPGTIEGTVRRGGAPAAGARVEVRNDTERFNHLETTTDAEGRYRFVHMPLGMNVVSAGEIGKVEQTAIVREEETTVVDFELGAGSGAIAGRLTVDGAPVERAEVLVRGVVNGLPYNQTARAEANGSYRLADLPAGAIELHATAYGPERARRFHFYDDLSLSDGEAKTLDIDIPLGTSSIAVDVTDTRQGVTTIVRLVEGRYEPRVPMTRDEYMALYERELYDEYVRADETKVIDGLEAGSYTLIVSSVDDQYMWQLASALEHAVYWHEYVTVGEGEGVTIASPSP